MYDAQEKMLKELMAMEFMVIDLNLYLNTHPYDGRALMVFISTAQRSRMIRDNYERMYGPITASASNSYPWPWIDSPWPWEG
jgi:spore coat protein JB